MYNFTNLKTPINTGSGVAQTLLIAPLEWFQVVQSAPDTGAHAGDEVRIVKTHLFKAGFGFVEMLLSPDANQFDAKTIGDKGLEKLDQTLKVFLEGSYMEVHEAMKNLLNVPFIALIKDSNCTADMWYQLGTSGVPAFFSVNYSTGATKDGKKGYIVELSYTNRFIQLYDGNIKKSGQTLTILLGVDDMINELDYILGLDDDSFLGFEL